MKMQTAPFYVGNFALPIELAVTSDYRNKANLEPRAATERTRSVSARNKQGCTTADEVGGDERLPQSKRIWSRCAATERKSSESKEDERSPRRVGKLRSWFPILLEFTRKLIRDLKSLAVLSLLAWKLLISI